MSGSAKDMRLNIPNDVLETYKFLLSSNTEGIVFLFSSAFTAALEATAERLVRGCGFTVEKVINEFRRLLAIKVFSSDEDATKISPTPLSMSTHPDNRHSPSRKH